MSENLKKYSFNELLNNQKVRVPKIQRDYVQGRINPKVDEIRKNFIHTLFLVVKGSKAAAELDFIYGSDRNDAFEPLDGQQRLTTLFLFHWMLGVELSLPNNKIYSLFTYETRNTSNEFCDELVQHKAIQFVEEAIKKNTEPSEIIRGRDWFKWEWKYDPTILSMLVMIDAIYGEILKSIQVKEGDELHYNIEKFISNGDSYRKNLENIKFNLLNLGKFDMSDELFIKMNARGKQLSDFDKLKSTLEEELQIQQKEKNEKGELLATPEEEKEWRTLMDGVWIDFFWHKYARQRIIDTENWEKKERKKERLKVANLSEIQFKKLLLRMIALQLFERENISDDIADVAYNLDEDKIDKLLLVYSDSLTDLRSKESYTVPSTSQTIDFKRLIEDVNLLLYKENDIFFEFSYLLSPDSHISPPDSQKSDKEDSLFDSFLETKVPNDVELTFYSMLLFLRAFPPVKEDWLFVQKDHKDWLKNLEVWVTSARNILLNDNNTQRIDKLQYSREATLSLQKLVGDLKSFIDEKKLDIESYGSVVWDFFASSNTTYTRLDNQSLAEEREKASLILLDSNWEKEIKEAEKHSYLWGQIRCLFKWSNNELEKFKQYRDKLISLLNFISNNHKTYYSAMLAFKPDCWENYNRLFQHNRDRDNSFKRYLRDDLYENGSSIKDLIDVWITSYNGLDVKDFLEKISELDCPMWIRCIVEDKDILDESWNKRLFKQDNHIILAQRKTSDSHCFDPILVYLRNLCRNKEFDPKTYKFYDSKGEPPHYFMLEKGGKTYHIEWNTKGDGYLIKEDDSDSQVEKTPQELIDYIKQIIEN